MKTTLAAIILAAACLQVIAGDESVTNNNSRTGPFILGAEVSWVPEDEADGAEYYDHGVRKDIFQILKDYQFNYLRLRLFVNPASTNGYARRRAEAFCDLDHVKALAKRARAAGMGLLLDIHYGDTWTSPGHQEKPVAWKDLNFQELTQAVRDFTFRAIYEMKTNGTPVNMVQLGNEISDGLLFPDGRRSNWDNFAALLRAGVAGAKEADPSVKIVLQHHLGRSNERMRPWLDNLIQRGVQFDIIGMSCYAQAQEGDWKNNFDDLAKRYRDKGLLLLEYSARKRYVNDMMFNTPDQKGLGTFIWEPTRHREALFDKDGRNAGGGQASNFTTDEGINQGARTNSIPATNPPARLPASTNMAANTNSPESIYRRFGTNEAARAEWRKRRFGGRYDVNELMDLYPQMSKDYGNDKLVPPKAGNIVPAPGPRERAYGISGPGAKHTAAWTNYNQKCTGSAVKAGLIPNLKPLIPDTQLRDTVVRPGGDGNYYLTGSSGADIWDFNDGIELWRSPDLKTWDYVGEIWNFDKDGTWQKDWRWHRKPVRAIWAPEIIYLKSLTNYFITLCTPPGNRGILKSTTGKPEGPYVNALANDGFFKGGIDATLFEDDDGRVYFLSGGGGSITLMKPDLSGFDGEPHRIVYEQPADGSWTRSSIGQEGASLFKRNGVYYLGGAAFYRGRYSSVVAMSTNLFGPYKNWHEAVPCGGGTDYFQDREGNWWCAFFGNDYQSPFREKPAILRIDFAADGKIVVAKHQPDFVLQK